MKDPDKVNSLAIHTVWKNCRILKEYEGEWTKGLKHGYGVITYISGYL